MFISRKESWRSTIAIETSGLVCAWSKLRRWMAARKCCPSSRERATKYRPWRWKCWIGASNKSNCDIQKGRPVWFHHILQNRICNLDVPVEPTMYYIIILKFISSDIFRTFSVKPYMTLLLCFKNGNWWPTAGKYQFHDQHGITVSTNSATVHHRDIECCHNPTIFFRCWHFQIYPRPWHLFILIQGLRCNLSSQLLEGRFSLPRISWKLGQSSQQFPWKKLANSCQNFPPNWFGQASETWRFQGSSPTIHRISVELRQWFCCCLPQRLQSNRGRLQRSGGASPIGLGKDHKAPAIRDKQSASNQNQHIIITNGPYTLGEKNNRLVW